MTGSPGAAVVAIDGPAGAGKSTVARAVAAVLDLPVLDTGAMYRAVTLAVLRAGLDPAAAGEVAALARVVRVEVGDRVVVDGDDVTDEIRGPAVTAAVSPVSAIPAVREILVDAQRAWVAERGGAVVEGRDIGTVVFPDARVKVFLSADPAVRAARRQRDEAEADRAVPVEHLRAQLDARDRYDSGRASSPLVRADGAIDLDTTELSVEEAVARVLAAWDDAATAASDLRADPAPAPGLVGDAGMVALPAAPAKRVRGDFDITKSLSGWRRVAYQFARLLVKGTCTSLFRAEVHGREHVPATGAYVLAPTHRSGWDIPLASLVTRRRVRFMGKASIWRVPVVGELLALLGGFPVERGTADQRALRQVLTLLQHGEPVVIYPEGTRQRGDEVAELFDGAAWVAARARVPILPVGIAGSQSILRSGRGFTLPKVVISVGAPVVMEAVDGRVPRAEVRRVTQSLRPALQALYDDADARRLGRRPR